MELLKKTILASGTVVDENILKVDAFLNHQVDPQLMWEIGRQFAMLFKDLGITKVITIESSGIAPAVMTALHLQVPFIIAKKTLAKTLDQDIYTAKVKSFTRGNDYILRVSKKFLQAEDKILLLDDFMAQGQAFLGLMSIAREAKAEIIGGGIVIEKAFQPGGKLIRDQGIRVESLARIESMSKEKGIQFL